ncbi:MAG TPA: acyl-CoA dehydrogenase family protein [Dehalococcoidia bacterium]|nr:acyl-CoA dehydrogenase family protein [Dehalococcoidia bacterium]
MDFRFTPQEEQFRGEVQQFLKEELPPGWQDQFDTDTDMGLEGQSDFARGFTKKLAQRRWLTMPWPAEYGGLGASVMQQMIYNEELSYANAPATLSMGVAWVGPALMIYGTDEQKKRFLPPIASHDEIWCTLYSEPAAGSDLAALQTRAVRDGDEWVLNGQKIWTTGAQRSEWGWLAARTDPEAPKHKGISMFIVPMDAPGISVRPLVNMAGMRGFNEVFFEDVRIPASYLVGTENQGWYQLAVSLDFERSSIAGAARARRWLEDLVAFAREHRWLVDGHPAVRHRLAETTLEVEVGRYLSYRVASLQQAGKIPNHEASVAKLYSSELGQRLARAGIDLLGLYGQLHPRSKYAYLKGRVERYYQVSVAETIAGGTSEIQRGIIAMRGLGLPRG